jgi:hypothetical protein
VARLSPSTRLKPHPPNWHPPKGDCGGFRVLGVKPPADAARDPLTSEATKAVPAVTMGKRFGVRARGGVAAAGACSKLVKAAGRAGPGSTANSDASKDDRITLNRGDEGPSNSRVSVSRIQEKMTKLARLSPSVSRHKKTLQAGAGRAEGYNQEYLEKVCFRAWSATASVTAP